MRYKRGTLDHVSKPCTIESTNPSANRAKSKQFATRFVGGGQSRQVNHSGSILTTRIPGWRSRNTLKTAVVRPLEASQHNNHQSFRLPIANVLPILKVNVEEKRSALFQLSESFVLLVAGVEVDDHPLLPLLLFQKKKHWWLLTP